MRFLSLFSGIEASSAAWIPLGWKCVAVSEIDPHACAVLAARHPNVPNLGDITTITEDDIKALGHLDLVVFGSPCQDLSIAGARKGFTDADGQITRSGLFMAAVAIFQYARQHCGARYALWENVPGAFSSNKGKDFAAVVSLLSGTDSVPVPKNGWGSEGAAVGRNGLLEWSVLDAQWFNLAQRRKRVFALLDTGNWYDRSPVLLQPNQMRGNTAPSRTPRQDPPSYAVCGSDRRSVSVDTFRLVSFGEYSDDGTACTMMRRDYKDATDATDLIAYSIQGAAVRNPGNKGGPTAMGVNENVNFTLCRDDRHVVAYNITFCDANGRRADRPNGGAYITEAETALTLTTGGNETHVIEHDSPRYMVRRLTPVECARLQGFPDWHCDVTYQGKPLSTNAKYALFGNSMAVKCMEWIGRRIDETHTESLI